MTITKIFNISKGKEPNQTLLNLKILKGVLKTGMKGILNGKSLVIVELISGRGVENNEYRVEKSPKEVREGWMAVALVTGGDQTFFEKNKAIPIEFT